MSVPPSTTVNLTLPRWAYVPGVETEADHETLAMAKALVPIDARRAAWIDFCQVLLNANEFLYVD